MTIGRYWQRGLRKPLALVIVALVAQIFAVAAVANAQAVDDAPTTFVSNHGQQDSDGFLTYSGTVFQGFTTGGIRGATSCRR